jgi:AcrR family transcriptional regulator
MLDRYFQDGSDGDSKRSRTRALILDTAIELMAEKGIERASIAEVAERAGIANGSFYYHFKDKTRLVEAVGGAIASALVQEVDDAVDGVDNGPERVAIASMLFIERGAANTAWGALIVHALADLGEFREQISQGIQKDVRIGISQGTFDVEERPEIYPMLLAMVGAALRERLARPRSAVAVTAASLILSALGMDAREVRAVVRKARRAPALTRASAACRGLVKEKPRRI